MALVPPVPWESPAVDTSDAASLASARLAGPLHSRPSHSRPPTTDVVTSPSRHSANTHPYAAITSSSGTLTRSNSAPASASWVPSHKGSRSLSSMDEQQPRPLPTPPGCRPLPAGQPASRTPVARGHRRADSLPFTFPSAPLVKHSSPDQLAKLPRDPAQWTHGQLLQWLEFKLTEASLAKPVVQDVLSWLGQSRPGEHGARVGGLSLDGREFLKGESGAWATTGPRPPFHTLLFQLSKSLGAGRHPRQASTVMEADESGDETPVKRLVRGWEERSSSSASEAGSEDDADDGAINGDGLQSPSARRSRESEKRYRRRSSLKNAEVAPSLPHLARSLSTESTSSAAVDTPSLDSATAVFGPAPDYTPAPDGSPIGQPPEQASISKRRERKSYDGLRGSHEGPEGEDREERRILTIRPRKSSGPPSLGVTSFTAVPFEAPDTEDIVRLRTLVVTLSDRMRVLESRLDSLEALGHALAADSDVSVRMPAEADESRRSDAASAMTLRQLPGFLCLASLGVGIIIWGVIARSRRGGRV